MYKLFVFIWLLCAPIIAFAQQENHLAALNEKKKLCEKISNTFVGSSANIDSLILVGNQGLKLAQARDNGYKFIFNQSIAIGYYYKQDFSNARKYFEAAYAEAVTAGLIENSLKSLGNLLAIYHYLGLQEKADAAAQKLKQIAESTDTLKYKTDVYYNLGIYNQQQKFYYSIALEDFLKSVELHKPIVDTTKILKRKLDYGAKLMMVAEIYLYLKQPNKALQYLNEAKPYTGLSVVVDVAAYGKFIRTYALLNNGKEALKYYNLLFKKVEGTSKKWSELVSSNIEMANLAFKAKDNELAKTYIDRANKQVMSSGSGELLGSAVNLLYGDYYKLIADYAKAEQYYKLAENGSRIYNKEQYANVLKNLTEVEIKNGKNKDAESSFAKYTNLTDSLNQSKISLNLAEMEARFQNEYKQKQIGSLNKDNENKSLQLKQEKNTRWFLIATAILLFLVVLSVYYNFRSKQKINRILDKKNHQLDLINEQLSQSNQAKAKLFSIITHDLRSPVSQLFSYLQIQQVNKDTLTVAQQKEHQEKLLASSNNLLETMEDLLLWSKTQMDHFEIDKEEIDLEELFNNSINFINAQADAKGIKLKIELPTFLTLNSDLNVLQAILRNLLQNAVNNAYQNTAIVVRANFTDQQLKYISVINHAAVIPQETIDQLMNEIRVKSKSSGYGLLIVKELAEKLAADLLITSNEDNGTEVKIIFKD